MKGIKKYAAVFTAAALIAAAPSYAETIQHSVTVPVVQSDSVLLRDTFELFGADVTFDWESSTVKAVKGENEMIFKIGESTAVFNEKEVALASKTYIENGKTYVSLDAAKMFFNAQAEVGGGVASISATVTQADPIEDYSEYLERSTTEKVGSSKYGWSIKRGNNFAVSMSYGGTVYLTNNTTEARISISVAKKDEYNELEQQLPTTIETLYDDILRRYSVAEYVEIGEKPSKTKYVAVNTGTTYFEIMESGDYVYSVNLSGYSLEKDYFEKLILDVRSFDLVFDAENTQDCIKSEEGLTFDENEVYNYTMGIPSEFTSSWGIYANEDEDPMTYFVAQYVYSDYESYVQNVYNELDEKLNKEMCILYPVQRITVDGKNAAKIKILTDYGEKKMEDIFVIVENGDYVFLLAAHFNENSDETLNTILENISLREVDSEKAGKAAPTDYLWIDRENTIEAKSKEYNVTISNRWKAQLDYGDDLYFDGGDGATISVSVSPVTSTRSDIDSLISDEVSEVTAQLGSEIIGQTEDVTVSGIAAKRYKYVLHDVDDIEYGKVYDNVIFIRDGKIYEIYLNCSEVYYGEKVKADFEAFLNSFTLK